MTKKNIEMRMIPVHGNPGDKELVNTFIRFFFCSRISFICATWMQAVTQSRILSREAEKSSNSSASEYK